MVLETVDATAELIANYNAKRQTISFGNEGVTNIHISNLDEKGLTTNNAKWRLAPGDTLDFSLAVDGKEIRQPWSAISDAAGGLLRWGDMAERE